MNLQPFADYGLPGLAISTVVALVLYFGKRIERLVKAFIGAKYELRFGPKR